MKKIEIEKIYDNEWIIQIKDNNINLKIFCHPCDKEDINLKLQNKKLLLHALDCHNIKLNSDKYKFGIECQNDLSCYACGSIVFLAPPRIQINDYITIEMDTNFPSDTVVGSSICCNIGRVDLD